MPALIDFAKVATDLHEIVAMAMGVVAGTPPGSVVQPAIQSARMKRIRCIGSFKVRELQ